MSAQDSTLGSCFFVRCYVCRETHLLLKLINVILSPQRDSDHWSLSNYFLTHPASSLLHVPLCLFLSLSLYPSLFFLLSLSHTHTHAHTDANAIFFSVHFFYSHIYRVRGTHTHTIIILILIIIMLELLPLFFLSV